MPGLALPSPQFFEIVSHVVQDGLDVDLDDFKLQIFDLPNIGITNMCASILDLKMFLYLPEE